MSFLPTTYIEGGLGCGTPGTGLFRLGVTGERTAELVHKVRNYSVQKYKYECKYKYQYIITNIFIDRLNIKYFKEAQIMHLY